MTDEFEGRVERRTLLWLSGFGIGGLALDGVSTVGAQDDAAGQTVGAADDVDLPNISGFHPVQVNGMPYGEGDEELPEGAAGEWADAYTETVDLVGAGEAPDAEARLRRKVVGNELYLGLSVSSDAGGDALSADQLSQLRLFIDRDGTGELTAGDVRLVGNATGEGAGFAWETQVYDGGEFVESRSDGAPPATASARDSDDDGVDIEARINRAKLDRALDGDSDDDQSNLNAELSTEAFDWGVNHDPTEIPDTHDIPGYSPTPLGNLDLENSSVERVEVTQSVQRQDNSLRLVRGKETLARVFVDHPESSAIEVDVELEGYDASGGGQPNKLPGSPLTESGFQAPPTPLDRENEDHSANFELPARWTNVGRLRLVARVNRPGHVDLGYEDRAGQATVGLTNTYDPTIHFGRVDEQSTPGRPSLRVARAVQRGFTEVMPIADPTFSLYTSNRIRNVAPNDDLIAGLDFDALYLKVLPNTGTVDHVYGLTQDYAGSLAGLSSPSWGGGPNNHRAAWGDDIVTNGGGSYPTLMGHEVNHNVGGDNWALHCQDDSDFNNDCRTGEVGWSPTYGIVPASLTELMKSGDFNDPDPTKWIGPDRWNLLFDRFENFNPGNPRPPSYGGPPTTPGPVRTAESHSPVRVITGSLSVEGGGTLDPSFEVPGETTEPSGVEDPDALLQVESAESTRTIGFKNSFEPIHDETVEESAFSFAVPGGDIEAVRLLDAETEEELDALEATGFELETAAVEVPDRFEREEEYEVPIGLEADTETPLSHQLLYSPDDGETWLPHSETSTEDSQMVFFGDGPGGESARFMLLVSDGVQTERVESESFTVPPLPPTVEITGAHRWAVEEGELQDVAGPVDAVVGSEVPLRASATDQSADALTGDAIEWTVETEAGDPVPVTGSAVGEQFRHRFSTTGTYTVRATATDPGTDLADDDEITVEVGHPALPAQETVEQFRERDSGSAAVVLEPGSQSISPDERGSFDLTVLGAGGGIGAYELVVESTAPDVLTVVDYDLATDSSFADVELAEDGSLVEFNVALGENPAEPGDVTLATLTVEGQEEATASLELLVEEVGDASEPIETYEIVAARGTSVTISEPEGPPAVSGDDPPQDTDGDNLYEDIDGDGDVDIFDVQALFNNLDNPVVQENAEFFNFSGDEEEEVNIFDVQALFNQLD